MQQRKALKTASWIAALVFFFSSVFTAIPVLTKMTAAADQFASCRLLVETGDETLFQDTDPVISEWNGMYLLQFDSSAETAKAYRKYRKTADLVEADRGIAIAQSEAAETVYTDTVMTEEENPFAKLENTISEHALSGRYDIALIDTGAEGADEMISMIGEDPYDENGHGSRMLSFLTDQNPSAHVLSIKALGADGTGDLSAVYAAIRCAIEYRVKIINLSLSALAFEQSAVITEAVKEAAAQGILVVGAAGNNGKDARAYLPGGIEEALIVGSCDPSGNRLEFSNYGPTVDYMVVSDSTSEAAASFSGWLSAHEESEIPLVVNKGFLFAADGSGSEEFPSPPEEQEKEVEEPESADAADGIPAQEDGLLGDYSPEIRKTTDFSVAAKAKFYTVSNADDGPGAGDIFFYGMIGGKKVTAYCLNFGKNDPKGLSYSSAAADAGLGYILCNGTHTGIGPRYTTQLAVYLFLGYTLDGTYYNNNGGLMASLRTVATNMGADITAAINLANAAKKASSVYAQYATKWKSSNSQYQNMVTFIGTGNLQLKKNGDLGKDPLGYALYTIYQSDKSTAVGWFITDDAGTGYVAERVSADKVSSFKDQTKKYTSVTKRGKAGTDLVVPKNTTVKASGGAAAVLVNKKLSAKTTYDFGRLNADGTSWYVKTSSKKMKLPAGKYYYKESYEPMNQLYEKNSSILGPITVSKDGTVTISATDQRETGQLKLLKELGTGSLTISKVLDGEGADLSKAFLFDLYLTSAKEKPLTGSFHYTGAGGKADGVLHVEEGRGSISLCGGESITLSGLPCGTRYTVTEESEEMYLPSDNPLSGQIAPDKEFTFTINIKDGTSNVKSLSMPYTGSKKGTLKTNAKGNATVTLKGGQNIVLDKIPTGYTYTVKEAKNTDFSTTKKGAAGTISSRLSTAEFTNTPERKEAAFINTFQQPEFGSFRLSKDLEVEPAEVEVKKVVESDRMSDRQEEFAFLFTATKEGVTYSKYDENEQLLPDFDQLPISSTGEDGFTLRHGQSVKIFLPEGAEYTIEELMDPQKEPYRVYVAEDGQPDRENTNVMAGEIPQIKRDQNFLFTVFLMDDNGEAAGNFDLPYSGTVAGMPKKGTMRTDAQGRFEIRLADGDQVLFQNLPAGYRYTVREEESDRYTQTAFHGENVCIRAGTVEKTQFVNTVSASGQHVVFYNLPTPAEVEIQKMSVADSRVFQLSDPLSGSREYQTAHGSAQPDGNQMYSTDLSDVEFRICAYDRNDKSRLLFDINCHPTQWKTEETSGRICAFFTLSDPGCVTKVNSGTVVPLSEGDKLVVTEQKAPKGYLLPHTVSPDATDTRTILSLSDRKEDNILLFEDPPVFAPADLGLVKTVMKYHDGVPSVTDTPLWDALHYETPMGAVFLVSYFDNPSCEGRPVRYWYLMTDENGHLSYSNEFLIGGSSSISFREEAFYQQGRLQAVLPDGYEWENKGELFEDGEDSYGLPLGSVSFREVWAPAGYKLLIDQNTGEPFEFKKRIAQEQTSGAATLSWLTSQEDLKRVGQGAAIIENDLLYAADEELNIAISKYAEPTGDLLADVRFRLTDLDDPKSMYQYQTTDAEEAHVIRGFLMRGHRYELEETGTANGYVLCEDKVTFYVDLAGNLHFEDVTDVLGLHRVPPVTHKLESADKTKTAEQVSYVVKPEAEKDKDYEIAYRQACVDESGRIGQEGDRCIIFLIANRPNRLNIVKTDDRGAALQGVVFRVEADSLPNEDHSTIIGYRDVDCTEPFYNGDNLVTDEKGEASLYRLRSKISLTDADGIPEEKRQEETYFLTETKTVEGKQLLAARLAVRVSAQGRILGTLKKQIGTAFYRYEGNETRRDGDIVYTLYVKNGEPVTLRTGGPGMGMLFLAGGILAVLTGLGFFWLRRKEKTFI